MTTRKQESGSAKRKRAKRVDDLVQSQRGDILKFFKGNSSASKNPDEWAIVVVEEEQPTQANGNSESDQQEENVDNNIGNDNVSGSDAQTQSASVDEQPVHTSDIYDPRN